MTNSFVCFLLFRWRFRQQHRTKEPASERWASFAGYEELEKTARAAGNAGPKGGGPRLWLSSRGGRAQPRRRRDHDAKAARPAATEQKQRTWPRRGGCAPGPQASPIYRIYPPQETHSTKLIFFFSNSSTLFRIQDSRFTISVYMRSSINKK